MRQELNMSDVPNKRVIPNKRDIPNMSDVPKTTIFGVPFSKLGMDDTVALLTEVIEARRKTKEIAKKGAEMNEFDSASESNQDSVQAADDNPESLHHVQASPECVPVVTANPEYVQVVTANPEIVMAGLENRQFFDLLQKVDLIVPDGIGVVWAAQTKGVPVSERVPGYDLLHRLVKEGSPKGWKVYLLGGSEDTVQLAARRLEKDNLGIKIVGARDGYFKPEEEENIVEEIRSLAPDLLFVGLGAPKQEYWIAKYKERLQVSVMMGVGGSFDGIAGKVKRAPVLFQKLKLEWFYRLLKQPSRWRRMLALPKFALKVVREKEKL